MTLKVLRADELNRRAAVIVGTRPGIIKFAPVIKRLERDSVPHFVIHTGQHYSFNMDQIFFDQLELTRPAHVVTGTKDYTLHGEQTAEMLRGVEQVLLEERPSVVIVGGDANTNLAGALATRKLGITLIHMEAGLRSWDWSMPEEHNRVMIDHISDLLLAPTPGSRANLEREMVRGKIIDTGNSIVDSVREHIGIAERSSDVLERFGVSAGGYLLLTVHREENVDSAERVEEICDTLEGLAETFSLPIVFPAHPRTFDRLERFGALDRVKGVRGLQIVEAVGYLDFLKLTGSAALVLTDSGGIQEEACLLHVPCVTLRENSERMETVDVGANIIGTTKRAPVLEAVRHFLEVDTNRDWANPFGEDPAAKIASAVAGAIDGLAAVR
jgi:UDP-N-acetylglucosamine 2-epimerase (non-hydrolysing)